MKIRQWAKERDWEVVGKLTRCADAEQSKYERVYADEAGNEYIIDRKRNSICVCFYDYDDDVTGCF